MESSVDVDQLDQVLIDHPWLVGALLEGDWWALDDGHVQFRTRIESHDDRRAGLVAFAEAMGLELQELPPDAEPPFSEPDEPPVSFRELRC